MFRSVRTRRGVLVIKIEWVVLHWYKYHQELLISNYSILGGIMNTTLSRCDTFQLDPKTAS